MSGRFLPILIATSLVAAAAALSPQVAARNGGPPRTSPVAARNGGPPQPWQAAARNGGPPRLGDGGPSLHVEAQKGRATRVAAPPAADITAPVNAQTRRAAPQARVRPPAAKLTPAEASQAAPLDAPLPGARSPRNASYVIEVALDPAARTLTGRERITWRNISRAPASELRFHLYFNAWKNNRSSWMREALLAGRRGGTVPSDGNDYGWTDVKSIRIQPPGAAAPTDVTPLRRFVQPDDGNTDDETVMTVPLPSPVAGGESVVIDIDWTAHVPRTFSRTGAVGNYFFLAQWFPKIGVLEETGWNCHQFHAGTEFYADYGTYDVTMKVPRGWVVGASGRQQERRDEGTITAHRYVEEDIHDFAWTTSPDYIERTAGFAERGLPPVAIRLLMQPEHASQAERHVAATRAALYYYGKWFGAYPYNHITVVDPAWRSGAGGMEYPTLFTAGTRWLAPARANDPEGVTVHECGHQFWYAIVGNNEFEHAWLDEGLNTYSTGMVMERFHQPNYLEQRFFGGFVPLLARDVPLLRETYEDGLESYREAATSDTPATPSWRYWPGSGGGISYSKTALWLHTLERHLGTPVMRRILSTYFDRWKFRHPKPGDFFAVVNEVSGRDMTWFFDEVYRGIRGVRLRRPGAVERAGAGDGLDGRGQIAALRGPSRRPALPHHRRRAPLRRRGLPGGRRGGLRERRAGGAALGRPRSMDHVHLRPRRAGALGGGRSAPHPAARRQPDQQQPDSRAGLGPGGHQVGRRLDGLAPGPADELRLLRVRLT